MPTDAEKTAVEAVFSFRKETGAIPGRGNTTKHLLNLSGATTDEIWRDWSLSGDDLIDPAGNRYGQCEIRAIFYTRGEIAGLRKRINELVPPPKVEPQQLTFAFMRVVPPRGKR